MVLEAGAGTLMIFTVFVPDQFFEQKTIQKKKSFLEKKKI